MFSRLDVMSSRGFIIWRTIYMIMLLMIFFLFFIRGIAELGLEPGFYLLLFGVLPSAIFMLMLKLHLKQSIVFAYLYDCFVLIGFVLLAFVLPNYLGLIILSPLLGYVVEWLIVTLLLFANMSKIDI